MQPFDRNCSRQHQRACGTWTSEDLLSAGIEFLMRSRFATHFYARWMTIFVVWFACLAPTVSHVLRDRSLLTLGTICTSSAFLSANINGDSAPSGDPSDRSVPRHAADGLAHCPFCSLQGHDSALPSQPLTVSMPGGLRVDLPRLFLQGTHTLHTWTSAQPRAPPRFS